MNDRNENPLNEIRERQYDQVGNVLLCISDARRRTSLAINAIKPLPAEPHITELLLLTEGVLGSLHTALLRALPALSKDPVADNQAPDAPDAPNNTVTLNVADITTELHKQADYLDHSYAIKQAAYETADSLRRLAHNIEQTAINQHIARTLNQLTTPKDKP